MKQPVPDTWQASVEYVVEVDISGLSDQAARAAVKFATIGAARGQQIRLRVGRIVPLWIVGLMRPDLSWQLVASEAVALDSWRDRLS